MGKFVLTALVTIACLAVQVAPAAAKHRVGDTQRQYQAASAMLTPPSHVAEWRHVHLKADGRGHEFVLKGAEEFAIKPSIDGRSVKYRRGALGTGSIDQEHFRAVVLSGDGRQFLEYAADKGTRLRLIYRPLISSQPPVATTASQ